MTSMINTNVFFDFTDFQVRRTGLDPQQRESHAGERQPGLGERHEHVARGMHAIENNNGTGWATFSTECVDVSLLC